MTRFPLVAALVCVTTSAQGFELYPAITASPVYNSLWPGDTESIDGKFGIGEASNISGLTNVAVFPDLGADDIGAWFTITPENAATYGLDWGLATRDIWGSNHMWIGADEKGVGGGYFRPFSRITHVNFRLENFGYNSNIDKVSVRVRAQVWALIPEPSTLSLAAMILASSLRIRSRRTWRSPASS